MCEEPFQSAFASFAATDGTGPAHSVFASCGIGADRFEVLLVSGADEVAALCLIGASWAMKANSPVSGTEAATVRTEALSGTWTEELESVNCVGLASPSTATVGQIIGFTDGPCDAGGAVGLFRCWGAFSGGRAGRSSGRETAGRSGMIAPLIGRADASVEGSLSRLRSSLLRTSAALDDMVDESAPVVRKTWTGI